MGRRGPAPLPTKTLELRGSWRAKTRRNEPIPPVETPTCPTWLNREAKAEWQRVVPQLKRLGIIARIDRACLAGYCLAWSRLKQATDILKAEGMTYEKNGLIKKHPAVGIAHEAAQEVRALAAEFGMSASARARLQIDPPKTEDALDRFLRQKDPKDRYRRPG